MGVCKVQWKCEGMPVECMGVDTKRQGNAGECLGNVREGVQGECRGMQGNAMGKICEWVKSARGIQGNVWEWVQNARGMQGNAGE